MSDINANQAAQPAASASGEPALNQSAPVQPVSSGSTDTQVTTLSTAPVSIQTMIEAVTQQTTAEPSTTAPAGTVGEQGNVSAPGVVTGDATQALGTSAASTSVTATPGNVSSTLAAAGQAGEQGNVLSAVASGADANSATAAPAAQPPLSDSAAADAASRVLVVPTPSTDSQTNSPTGGPIAGRGDTPDAKAKHGFLDHVRDDLHAELTAIEGLPRYVLHVLEAVFDRHHSHVDNQS